MTEIDHQRSPIAHRVEAGIRRRYRADTRFRWYGIGAIVLAIGFLAMMLTAVVAAGYTVVNKTVIALDITFDAATLGIEPGADARALGNADYGALIKKTLRQSTPGVQGRRARRDLYELVSPGAEFELRDLVLADPSVVGATIRVEVTASDDVDMMMKGAIPIDVPETERRINDRQLVWIRNWQAEDRIRTRFNRRFFTGADSREPELAGIWGAVVGSFLALAVCLVLSFPVGVLAAIYLESFAPHNRFTEIIEVNINNLAAVPSIVFGLLGLAVFLNWMELPRSAPLVGGMVLSLMTLPTIIIAARAALKSVPPSIYEAALAVGASPMQAVFHHVVPLAMPGMLTGTIIGMAQALGETAPLLMIGMVAFIADAPGGVLDPATALPVQVYLWADGAERAFVEKTAAAIMVLLAFLVCMNLTAVLLRKRFEQRF